MSPRTRCIQLCALAAIAASCSIAPEASDTATSTSLSAHAAAELRGPAYAMAFDAGRRAIWIPYMSGNGESRLYEFGTDGKSLAEFGLPATTHNGYLGRVAIAPDGSVWLTEAYLLVRVDPGARTQATLDLSPADQETAAGQAEPGSPGTWPSAITFSTAGDAIIARHNTSTLTVLDGSLARKGDIPLPSALASPGDAVDVAGTIYVAPYHGGGAGSAISETGEVISTLPTGVSSIAGYGTAVVMNGDDGTTLSSAGSSSHVATSGSGLDQIAMGPTRIAVYRQDRGVIEVRAADGKLLGTWVIPAATVSIPNPEGSMVSVHQRAEVGAIAVDSDDGTWFILNEGTRATLMRISE